MTPTEHKSDVPRERVVLVTLAVCCAAPMLAIVVLVGVIGVAIGPAAALSLGLVASLVCIAAMAQRHLRQAPPDKDDSCS